MLKIGTHSGSFHADDAVGISILRILNQDAEIIRTRDAEVLAGCDYVVDVGGVHDPKAGRFDHHQKGFSKKRENGTPYAGAGLVWAEFGEAFVRKVSPELTAEQVAFVAETVDTVLIQYVDAVDSGVFVPGPIEFGLASIIGNFNAVWTDIEGLDDYRFEQASHLAGMALVSLVRAQAAEQLAGERVRSAPQLCDGRVLVLDTPRLPFERYVAEEMPEVLYVVYPESRGQQYQVKVVPAVLGTFEARRDLPAAWAGLRDSALAEVTGVSDAVFCHNGRFICGAQSREGAIALASLALTLEG